MHNFFRIYILFVSFTFYAQKSTATRQVSKFEIDAPQLLCKKKIWIYLPKSYNQNKKQKYPVIYMHDAQNLFDSTTSYAGEWNVDEILDSLNANVIVVGIEHGNEKRLEELTPFKNAKYGGGNGNKYLDFIVNTLKPLIDVNYKTKPTKNNTAIFGSSLGGLLSYYAILKYPAVFGKAGVFSPSFWYSNDIYEFTKNTKKLKTKIYFMCGDNEDAEMVPDLQKMVYLVNSIRCHCLDLNKTVIIKGGRHNEKLWRENFKKAYLWLF